MAEGDTVGPQPAVILDQTTVNLNWMTGDLPGEEPGDDPGVEQLFGGNALRPPIDPMRAIKAVLGNGELASVMHAKANGAAGFGYKIVPRKKQAQGGPDMDNPSSWSPEMMQEHYRLQTFVQAGFQGKGVQSLRTGFAEQEHDRAILGWSGVTVFREGGPVTTGMPGVPKALGRFQAVKARFTKPDQKPTPVPVPVVAEDGKVLWIEEMRHFRRILFQDTRTGIGVGGKSCWYREYGDWRTMDSITGKRSPGYRRIPPMEAFAPGRYNGGYMPRNGVPSLEVMTWATSFPGADPYGVSGWHSELLSVDTAREAALLLLSHLKSGLHSVILAAANRPFEQASAEAAVAKIDELGRGRQGLGAMVLLSLVPSDSSAPSAIPAGLMDGPTADRGRLILHELNTKLPPEVMNGTVKTTTGESFARAERIPDLLLGKSGEYNFATAAAAWTVVNRLVFSPHHEEREAFLDRLLVEMGIQNWRLQVISPEWKDPPEAVGIATVASQSSGLSPNLALRLLSDVVDVPFKPFSEWWAEVPMAILTHILASPDPAGSLELFGYKKQAAAVRASGIGDVAAGVKAGLDNANAAADKSAKTRKNDETKG